MSKLEKDLLEYVNTREGLCDALIAKHGDAGAHSAVTEKATLADIRAILDGRPVPARGAE